MCIRDSSHIKRAARLIGKGQRPRQQLPRLLLHRHSLTGVEPADVAGVDGAGEDGLQPVDFPGGGGQRLVGAVAVGVPRPSLKDKNIAVQSTTKPEDILLNGNYDVGNLISLNHRELIFTFLQKGYVDAIGAHEESIIQYMKDYNADFRILEEPLMRVGIGVAFSKNDKRDLCEKLDQTLNEMRQDGTSKKIIGKYLTNPEKYLEVDDFAY